MIGSVLVCALLLAPAAGDASALPDSLKSLLEAQEDNRSVVTPEERAYFEGLSAHARELFGQAADSGMLGSSEQLSAILSLELPPEGVELVLTDNCILCHTNPDQQDERTLFSLATGPQDAPSHMNLKEVVSDVHFRRGLSCSGCHGGTPDVTEMVDEIYQRWPSSEVRATDRTWIPEFCARCHSDPATMRQFNPGLPTDQLQKYRLSMHGHLLLEQHDSKAAQCVSCHGVHGIQTAKNRASKVYPQNVPSTCGHCHANAAYMAGYKQGDGTPLPTNQLEEYKHSVHGMALLEKGDLGAPACNDCHGNHAALPPEVASVAEVCRTCHAGNGALFDGSRHKKAFDAHGWPACETCHGKHGIEKPSDAMLSVAPGGLCHDCHVKYAENSAACIDTAAHFHDTIVELNVNLTTLHAESTELAERGLDVEVLNNALATLEDSLRQSRSHIHTFDRSDFDQVVGAGTDAITTADKLVEQANGEYRFRRTGLAISIGIMVILALLLALKIRGLGK